MAEEQLFYRFRTLKNIFEYKELENLEIYFASTDELNDPMEAYKDVIFQGDIIMWHNLFKNYILCLSRFILVNRLKGNPNKIVEISSFDILNPVDNFVYSNAYYDLFVKIYKTFRKYYTKYIDDIFKDDDKVTTEALKVYLFIMNIIILEIIFSHLYKKIADKSIKFVKNKIKENIDFLLKYKNDIEHHYNETSCPVLAMQFFDNIFYKKSFNKTRFPFNVKLYEYILYGKFIDEYVNYLANFVRVKNYTASFNTDVTNPVMWSHYTENHNGICLIYKSIDNKMEFFKNKTNKKNIPLKNITLEFKKVNYKYEDNTVNFFYIFLRDKEEIKDNWHKDFLTNKKSKLYDNYKTNKQYIQNEKNLHALPLYKTNHWNYEKEYRLILDERNELKKEDKIYKYDFNYLDGIIFGMKTPLNEKLKIINIIKKLCKKNKKDFNTFKFYQAFMETKYQNINYYQIYITDTTPTEQNNE